MNEGGQLPEKSHPVPCRRRLTTEGQMNGVLEVLYPPCVGKTFKRGDRKVIPRKVLSHSGVREDFSKFMRIPKREQRLMRQAVALRASSAD